MVCLLMFMLVAALSCLWMVVEEAVLVCNACLWMKRFSRCVVFLGASRPASLLDPSCGEDALIPSRLATSRLEMWSWSHAVACTLSKSVSCHCGGMIRTSLTVAKGLFIKPQM